VARRTVPSTHSSSPVQSAMAAKAVSAARAWRSMARAVAVIRGPAGVRSNRVAPRSPSSAVMRRPTVDGSTRSRRAARANEPSRATARNTRMSSQL